MSRLVDESLDEHQRFMRIAVTEAEHARGHTGDNPWVGCAIVSHTGELLARGHTLGPGEDHAEIVALRRARELGVHLESTTLYSTLEPCSFHGRTPACARAIADAGVRRVVSGLRDPNPRVDGLGVKSLEQAGVEVLEGVCALEITRQLASWIFRFHPHEPLRRASALMLEPGSSRASTIQRLCDHYGLDASVVEALMDELGVR